LPGSSDADRTPPVLDGRAKAAIIGAVLLALFLASLDQTIVGTALPTIVSELKGNDIYTWVVTAYLLTSTLTVPVYGKLSDVYGRKPLLLIGVTLFLIGSAASGQARSMEQLIGFRALQGLGAGALFPIALAVIGDIFSARERGRYQGLFGAVFGVSFILGPFLGGFLTDNWSWRWVFYVNLPIGLVALAVIATVLPNLGSGARARDLDYLGVLVFAAGVIPLLLGLTEKGQSDSSGQLYAWVSPQVGGLIAIGAVMLAVFVFVESRAREPIVPLDLFRNRNYSASMASVLLVGFAMFTAVIYLPRFYQVVAGVSATQSGYEIWPLLLGLMGGSIVAGQLISRIGRYKVLMLSSLCLLVLGGFLMTHLQASTDNHVLWVWMLLVGLGVGPGMAGYTVVVQSAVPLTRIGVATSTLTFFRQMGGSVGLAIAGTIFNATFTSELPRTLAANGVPQGVISQFATGGASNQLTSAGGLSKTLAAALPAELRPLVPQIVTGVHQAVALAVGNLFWLTLAAGAAALLCTLALKEVPLRGGPALREEHAAPADEEPRALGPDDAEVKEAG
jgi:EmrB/QacA subfamily drug resistance transporter